MVLPTSQSVVVLRLEEPTPRVRMQIPVWRALARVAGVGQTRRERTLRRRRESPGENPLEGSNTAEDAAVRCGAPPRLLRQAGCGW